MRQTKLTKAIEKTLKINLLDKGRDREISDGKRIYILIRFLTQKTKVLAIGRELNIHHSTVCHYKKTSVFLLQYDKDFREKVKLILEKVGFSKEKIEEFSNVESAIKLIENNTNKLRSKYKTKRLKKRLIQVKNERPSSFSLQG